MGVTELTDEKALQNFLLDIDCLNELAMWTEKFNIFDVLKISRTEIRHSNMLAWLFDANENHGIGDRFIKKILQKVVENSTDNKFDVFQILLLDFYSFNIYREWKNIDLLFVSDEEETVIVIENKVGSHEHSNQLNRYRKTIEKTYPKYNKLYLFLTPNGMPPSDTDNWSVLTYSDIVDALDEIKETTELLPDVALMINNYIDIVRRDILDDKQLIDICNKIYTKHKKALDLIFENRISNSDTVKNIVYNALSKLCDSGKIIYSSNSLRFHTYRMSEYLPDLENSNSSWGNKYPYLYWIYIAENEIIICFELGSTSVPAETLELMQPIIDELSTNDNKRYDFKYKKLKKFSFNIDFENSLNEDIEREFFAAVDKVLSWEEELLNKVTGNYNEQ